MATTGAMKFPDKQGKNRRVGYGVPPLETRFRPGQSGNPAGRPRRRTLSECLADLLASTETQGVTHPAGMTVCELLAEEMVKQALRGKFPFFKEVLDRTEGKVPERVALPDAAPPIDLSVL